MDGKLHRVPVEGARDKRNVSGSYTGHLDHPPSGWIKNWKTNEEITWKPSAPTQMLTAEQRGAIREKATQEAREKERIRLKTEEAISVYSQKKWDKSIDATTHPYLERKGIDGLGLKVDDQNRLLVPMRDVDGKLWSIQSIGDDGQKHFTKGGRKAGTLTTISAIEHGKPFAIAEGYATAASVHKATGLPVAVAYDSGNLYPVAVALAAKYPTSPVIVAGDNDHHLTTQVTGSGRPLGNVGADKAAKAAAAVDGFVVIPDFGAEAAGKGSDWNDYAQNNGIDATRAAIAQALGPETSRELLPGLAPQNADQNLESQEMAMRAIYSVNELPGGAKTNQQLLTTHYELLVQGGEDRFAAWAVAAEAVRAERQLKQTIVKGESVPMAATVNDLVEQFARQEGQTKEQVAEQFDRRVRYLQEDYPDMTKEEGVALTTGDLQKAIGSTVDATRFNYVSPSERVDGVGPMVDDVIHRVGSQPESRDEIAKQIRFAGTDQRYEDRAAPDEVIKQRALNQVVEHYNDWERVRANAPSANPSAAPQQVREVRSRIDRAERIATKRAKSRSEEFDQFLNRVEAAEKAAARRPPTEKRKAATPANLAVSAPIKEEARSTQSLGDIGQSIRRWVNEKIEASKSYFRGVHQAFQTASIVASPVAPLAAAAPAAHAAAVAKASSAFAPAPAKSDAPIQERARASNSWIEDTRLLNARLNKLEALVFPDYKPTVVAAKNWEEAAAQLDTRLARVEAALSITRDDAIDIAHPVVSAAKAFAGVTTVPEASLQGFHRAEALDSLGYSDESNDMTTASREALSAALTRKHDQLVDIGEDINNAWELAAAELKEERYVESLAREQRAVDEDLDHDGPAPEFKDLKVEQERPRAPAAVSKKVANADEIDTEALAKANALIASASNRQGQSMRIAR